MRLTTLSVTYAAVCGESIQSILAIDTLRVFCPAVYDIIQKTRTSSPDIRTLAGLQRPKREKHSTRPG